METADDIAYCMSDIADGIEKRILSIDEFIREFQKRESGVFGYKYIIQGIYMSTRYDSEDAAVEVLKDIKNGTYPNTLVMILMLKQIITDIPGTKTAREAQELLDELCD